MCNLTVLVRSLPVDFINCVATLILKSHYIKKNILRIILDIHTFLGKKLIEGFLQINMNIFA